MAGSLLGPDQIRKINATFPVLVAHIRSLLAADRSGVGLMRVHCMVETFDSDEMARIFREISYISPFEKKAFVRAAIYELMAKEPALFVSPEQVVVKSTIAESVLVKPEPAAVYSPRQFNLNVNTSAAAESAKTDTKPTPVVTSTHTSKAKQAIEEGNKRMAEHADKLDAAVAALRAESTPKLVEETLPLGDAAAKHYGEKIADIEMKAIELMDVPADVNLQDLPVVEE